MTIFPIHNEPLKGKTPSRADEVARERERVPPTEPVEKVEQADRVEISIQGRAQAEEAGFSGEASPSAGQDRLAEIRSRILSGDYDTPEMAEEVARRILMAGDLDI